MTSIKINSNDFSLIEENAHELFENIQAIQSLLEMINDSEINPKINGIKLLSDRALSISNTLRHNIEIHLPRPF